jgi:hypothetical protein
MSASPAAALSAHSVLRRADRTAWQHVDRQLVILDVPSRTLLGLNGTAARVWQLLDGERSLEAIALDLAEVFQQPATRVRSDVLGFAAQLLERGCVEQVPGGSGQRVGE